MAEDRRDNVVPTNQPHGRMRAADVDRQAVAERLRQAVDEGRLYLSEYDDRLGRAYAARTYGELAVLVSDLPGEPVPGGGLAPRQPAAAPVVASRWPRAAVVHGFLGVLAVSVLAWTVVSVSAGRPLPFWPGAVVVGGGLALLVRNARAPRRGAQRQHRERRG